MGIDNTRTTAQEILKLVNEGIIKAMTVEKTSISGDYLTHMKKTGWRLLRTDDLGKKLKCYFAKE